MCHLAFIFLLASLPALAEEPSSGAEQAWSSLGSVQALDATFTQEQTRALLSRPLVSSGRIRFERPSSLRWETTSPSTSVMVMSGTQLWMHVPDLGAPQELNMSDDPRVESLVRGLLVWLDGDLESVKKNYTLTFVDGPPAVATLVPRDETLRGTISSLELTLAPDLRWVQRVAITEPDGDTTVLTLSDVTTPEDIPNDVFKPQ